MIEGINLVEIQEKLKAYLGYYTECSYNVDEGMIAVKVFNVPEKFLDEVEDKVFDFEENELPSYGCILMPFVLSENVTKKYYHEVLSKVDAYNSVKEIDRFISEFLEKQAQNDSIIENLSSIFTEVYTSLNDLSSSLGYVLKNKSITRVKQTENVLESRNEQELEPKAPYCGNFSTHDVYNDTDCLKAA